GGSGVLFSTETGGRTWQQIRLPLDGVKIAKLHFFDGKNGVLYGNLSTSGTLSEYYATSNDGGVTWTRRDALGESDFVDLSIAGNSGVIAHDSGSIRISRIAETPRFTGTVSQSALGVLHFNVGMEPGPL